LADRAASPKGKDLGLLLTFVILRPVSWPKDLALVVLRPVSWPKDLALPLRDEKPRPRSFGRGAALRMTTGRDGGLCFRL
jgi:hypothetical protein